MLARNVENIFQGWSCVAEGKIIQNFMSRPDCSHSVFTVEINKVAGLGCTFLKTPWGDHSRAGLSPPEDKMNLPILKFCVCHATKVSDRVNKRKGLVGYR